MKTIIVTAIICSVLVAVSTTQARAFLDNFVFGYFCSRNGVEYVYFIGGSVLTVSYDQDGKPVRCKP